jgi:AcrR family transcriptional regulator
MGHSSTSREHRQTHAGGHTDEPRDAPARAGVGLDMVLRRYLAGYAVFEGFVIQEADREETDRSQPVQASGLRDLLQIVSMLVDRLITAASRAYDQELDRSGKGAGVQAVGVGEVRVASRRPGGAGPDRAGPGGSVVVPGRVVGTRRERTSRRDRILSAAIEVVAERGVAGASVKLVVARAGVSSRTFYECFTDLDDCLVAIIDGGLAHMAALASRAFEREESWLDGMRVALATVLWLFDSEPALARVLLVETLGGAPAVREHRQRGIEAFRSLLVARIEGQEAPPASSLVPEGVLASVMGIVCARVILPGQAGLIELLGPLMGIVVEPFMREERVAREIERGHELVREIKDGDSRWVPPGPPPALSAEQDALLPAQLVNPAARRLRACVLYVAEHPDSSNREVAVGVGVTHLSQISRLLARLAEEQLVAKCSEGAGKRNAWRLTPRGEEIARVLQPQGELPTDG